MHRILEAHLSNFAQSHGFTHLSIAEQFEHFVNYSILYQIAGSRIDLDNVTTGPGDDGTDGIAVLINEEIMASDDEAHAIFSTSRRNHDVEVVFIQSKTSESFDLGDFLKFKESILRFINNEAYAASDEVQINSKNIFDVSISNVPRIRNGKPSITVRYLASGIYQNPEALETARNDFDIQLQTLGYFSEIDIQFLGRDELMQFWISTYSGVQAQLDVFSHAALPRIEGVEEAYLAVVKAKDFVARLITTDEETLRVQAFEENVRAFLGLENPVNQSISDTLKSGRAATRFPVLNNGITIVSPDVKMQGTTLHLENYQIINGCQTSSVLFEERDSLDDSVMVNLKIIETSSEDVFSELVRATNSQTKVEENQFLSLRPIVKRIEDYFNTFEG